MKEPAAELSFRAPMAVTQARLFEADGTYPVCPQCKISLEREYQRFCDCCGQRLDWKKYRNAQIILPGRKRGPGGKLNVPAR